MGKTYSKRHDETTGGHSYHEDENGGFHVFELHGATMGATTGIFFGLIAFLVCSFALYRCLKSRYRRQSASIAAARAAAYDAVATAQLRGCPEPPSYDEPIRGSSLSRRSGRDGARRSDRPDYIVRVAEPEAASRAVSPRI